MSPDPPFSGDAQAKGLMRTRLRRRMSSLRGQGHRLWRNGEVVFTGNKIEFVGRGFEGTVDRDIDCGPCRHRSGLHRSRRAGRSRLPTVLDTRHTDHGLSSARRPHLDRRLSARRPHRCLQLRGEELFKYRYAFAQLIRSGITTAMPITSMSYRRWAETYDEFAGVAAIAGEMGIRAYLGPCYMSGVTITDPKGNLSQHWDEPRGLLGLEAATRFIRDFDGAHQGLVRAMLAPDRIETCTPELLRRTAALLAEAGVPVRLHCCQSRYEVELVKRLRGLSPYRWLDSLGCCDPELCASARHLSRRRRPRPAGPERGGSFIARWSSRATARRCARLPATARARIPDRHGTDTSPPDLIDTTCGKASISAGWWMGSAPSSAADFYTAATLGAGAAALGRTDIGGWCGSGSRYHCV